MRRLDRRSRRPGGQRWSLASLHFVALLMVWEADSTLQDAFCSAREHFIEMFPYRRRPGKSYQGFVKAQATVSSRMQKYLLEHLRGHHRRIAGSAWKIAGWTAFACDGSRIEAPRTLKNQRALGCAGRQKTGPQLYLTTLYHMGTGLPWDWRIGRGDSSERHHLRSMLANLPPHSLIVADAGFTGYDLMQSILAGGHSFLIRVGSSVHLLADLNLEIKCQENRLWLWPSHKRNQPPMALRLIRIGRMYLLTNELDTANLSNKDAAKIYRLRWGVEVFFRSYKQTLEARKLRSRSPKQARNELFWGVTGLLLLGLMSLERRGSRDNPRSFSVAGALRIIRKALRTTSRWRKQGNLMDLLKTARQDKYRRHGSKKSRRYPRKKNEPLPRPPKIRKATHQEKQAAMRFHITG